MPKTAAEANPTPSPAPASDVRVTGGELPDSDPVWDAMMDCPIDDSEPVTEEEVRAIEQVNAWLADPTGRQGVDHETITAMIRERAAREG